MSYKFRRRLDDARAARERKAKALQAQGRRLEKALQIQDRVQREEQEARVRRLEAIWRGEAW
jgi:hypothetical protein